MSKQVEPAKNFALIQAQLAAQKDALVKDVPAVARGYLTSARVVRILRDVVARNTMLMQCTPQSILKCSADMLQLGLEVGGPLGQAYLVPFRNGKTGEVECQAIIGYRGLIELARRSKAFSSTPNAQLVYKNDHVRIRLGSAPGVEHEPASGDRGEIVGAYCIAWVNSETHPLVEWMNIAEINKIRQRSKSRDNGPWVTDFDQMARKSVLRRQSKFWPMSPEMADAIDLDNRDMVVDAVFDAEPASNDDAPTKAEALTAKVRERLVEAASSFSDPTSEAPQ